jgi:hypothetical protein
MKSPRDFGLSGGDLGIIAIALVFALSGLYLMVGPSPFAALFVNHPKPAPTEVSIDLKTYSGQQQP